MESLIQRLNEVTARLIAQEKALQKDDRTLLECHGRLDGLETLVFGGVLCADAHRDRTPDRACGNRDNGDAATKTRSHSADRNNDSVDLPRLPSTPRTPGQRQIGHGGTLSVPQEQELFQRISRAAHELRNRHEELKHVHDLAIAQAGRAAQRILSLEAEVRGLDSDLTALRSSYTFLKLQLKTLEIQALRYIPVDDEEGLVEGFQRWKEDWRELDGQARSRQRSRFRRLRDEG